MEKFKTKFPVLLGFSYKRFLADLFPELVDRRHGNLAVISKIYKYTDILRVHDVKEAKECVNLLQELK